MRQNIRVVIPTTAEGRIELSELILEKDTADGVNTKLSNIDTTKFQSVLTQAKAKNTSGEQFANDAETATQTRNNALGISPGQDSKTNGTILFYITSFVKFLKGNFLGDEQKLGDWGFTVNINRKGNVTVVIPRSSPDKLIKLAKKIKAKDLADGIDSLLATEFDMADYNAKLAIAIAEDVKSAQFNRNKERDIKERDSLLGIRKNSKIKETAYYYILAVRNILLGIYNGNEQMLGDWGFEVNTSAPPPDPDPEPYTISGMVTSTVDATPIGDAMLTFNTSMGPLMTNTNPLGEYSLETPITADESANVSIMAMGFQPYAAPIMLTPEGSGVFNFELTPE